MKTGAVSGWMRDRQKLYCDIAMQLMLLEASLSFVKHLNRSIRLEKNTTWPFPSNLETAHLYFIEVLQIQ